MDNTQHQDVVATVAILPTGTVYRECLGLGDVHEGHDQLGNSTVRWTFAEWSDSQHINRGKFEFEPTLNNFLAVIINEAKDDWFII